MYTNFLIKEPTSAWHFILRQISRELTLRGEMADQGFLRSLGKSVTYYGTNGSLFFLMALVFVLIFTVRIMPASPPLESFGCTWALESFL